MDEYQAIQSPVKGNFSIIRKTNTNHFHEVVIPDAGFKKIFVIELLDALNSRGASVPQTSEEYLAQSEPKNPNN